VPRFFGCPMHGPNDVSSIDRLITDGVLDPQDITVILGKTEGNGCVNNFIRGYATQSLRVLLK
jgi:cyanuric acid amidohydrolase